MLSSHGGDGGSSPPESTHSHILACVCGRPARHAIATRNNPVRLRADALSYPEGLSPNLPPSGQARRVPLPIRETPDLGRRYCRSGAPGWTRSPGTGEKRVRLPRSAPRPRSRAAHRSRPGPAPAAWARRAPARPRPRAWTRPGSPKPGEVVRFHPVAPRELRLPARACPSPTSSSGQDAGFSPRQDGFDSRRGYRTPRPSETGPTIAAPHPRQTLRRSLEIPPLSRPLLAPLCAVPRRTAPYASTRAARCVSPGDNVRGVGTGWADIRSAVP